MARLNAPPHTRPRRPLSHACGLSHGADPDGASRRGGVDHRAALGDLHLPCRHKSPGCAASRLHQFSPGFGVGGYIARSRSRRDGPGSLRRADGDFGRSCCKQRQDGLFDLVVYLGHPTSAAGGRAKFHLLPVALPSFAPFDPATTRRADLLCGLRSGGSRHGIESDMCGAGVEEAGGAGGPQQGPAPSPPAAGRNSWVLPVDCATCNIYTRSMAFDVEVAVTRGP